MAAKFSHLTDNNSVSPYRVKVLCGKYVDGMNFTAFYGGKYSKPLCPKCAALKLIAETQVAV